MRKSGVAVLALVVSAANPASAAAIGSDWPVLAAAQDGDCALEITGNGKIFLISATGLGEGASGRYQISNGDMVPIDWSVRASGGGQVARYYMPFRWGHGGERIAGGTIDVRVTTKACALSASFPWQRGIRVID